MKGRFLLVTISLLVSLVSCKSTQQTPQEVVEKLGPNPYFIIDGEAVDKSELRNYDPSIVATLTTFYGKEAVDKYGEIAKDGAVVVYTKKFAIQKYQDLFSEYSQEYHEMISNTESDKIQYILNDEILTIDYEGQLALINNKSLKRLQIINSEELNKEYNITDKEVGVLIKAKIK